MLIEKKVIRAFPLQGAWAGLLKMMLRAGESKPILTERW
jgi:hypothetical protein